jgi:dTDP-4-dehydrorhamnose reductase
MNVPPVILVTGAAGQLGCELQELAPRYPRYKFIFRTREEMSIEQAGNIENVFEDLSPKYCINAAAYTAVDKAEDPNEREKVYSVNSRAVNELATVCNKFGTKLLQISTDYVFDGKKREPYTEEDEVNPVGIYGDSKLKGEEFALVNPLAVVLRTSWVYSSYGKNFVKTMLRLMKEKEEIRVVNDQFGSPTYAADIAEALMKMIGHKPWQPGLFHFTNHGVTNWFEFAGLIRDLSGSACKVLPISTAEYPTPAKRPAWSVLDNSKFNRVFDHAGRDWQMALEDCIRKIRSEKRGNESQI